MRTEKITIAVADDHKLFREMWTEVLNQDDSLQVVASCSSGKEAVEVAKLHRPQIFLMDINMKNGTGFEATSYITKAYPEIKIIAVSIHAGNIYVDRMMSLGASGYITKNSNVEELKEAISEVLAGRTYICREVQESYTRKIADNSKIALISQLSQREREILYLIREGLSSREIGQHLHISLKTVEAHRYNIIKKLQVKNMAALLNEITGIASDIDPLVV